MFEKKKKNDFTIGGVEEKIIFGLNFTPDEALDDTKIMKPIEGQITNNDNTKKKKKKKRRSRRRTPIRLCTIVMTLFTAVLLPVRFLSWPCTARRTRRTRTTGTR